MSAIASKRFTDEFSSALDKVVRVTTQKGDRFTGTLIAYNPSDYSLWLEDVKDDKGTTLSKLFIAGSSLATLEVLEKISGLDLQQLYERIGRVIGSSFVSYHKDAGVILVMDRIRVTKDGVEGTGPLAERVQKIYDEFIRESGEAGKK